jgi:hypothetical protein
VIENLAIKILISSTNTICKTSPLRSQLKREPSNLLKLKLDSISSTKPDGKGRSATTDKYFGLIACTGITRKIAAKKLTIILCNLLFKRHSIYRLIASSALPLRTKKSRSSTLRNTLYTPI